MTMTTVNWDQLYNNIVTQAVSGLNDAVDFATARAKYHAPVRNIFASGKRTGIMRNPRGPAFRGNARNWTEQDYKSFRKSKRRNRQMFGPGGDRIRGNIASPYPVFRVGPRTITANPDAEGRRPSFRDFDAQRGRLKESRIIGQRGSKSVASQEKLDPTFYLSGGGRREVTRAKDQGENTMSPRMRRRAGIDVNRMSALFEGTIGGRLRGEIRAVHASPTRISGGMIWGYVVSPTEYAIHQEFGTRRHRPQPFLRPALYESRAQLRLSVGSKGKMVSAMARNLARTR